MKRIPDYQMNLLFKIAYLRAKINSKISKAKLLLALLAPEWIMRSY